jgi:hypothetical protein
VQRLLRLWLFLALALRAAAATADDPRIAALGQGDHGERDRAERELWKLGDEALPLLRAAAEADDPEIAERAERLVKLIENGVYPDTPPALAEQLRSLPTLPLEPLARLVASNAADRVMGPRLLARSLAATRTRRDSAFYHSILRTQLREPLLALVAAGRAEDALRLLEIAAREGASPLAEPAAAAFWLEERDAGLIERLKTTPAAPGDPLLKANVAFNAADYDSARRLAAAARNSGLAAMAAALTGDWSEMDRLPWRNEARRNNGFDLQLLARARLFGDVPNAQVAVDAAINFAIVNPDDQWFALEVLLINDAWPSLPRYFEAVTNAALETDFAYELFQPGAFAKAAPRAWADADNPTLRYRLLRQSRLLTGTDPSDNRSEVRVAEQFGGPAGAEEESAPEEPDWDAWRDRLREDLKAAPESPATLLLLGWVESRRGQPAAAETWRRRAGWQMILGVNPDLARVQALMLEHPEDPYWAATVNLLRVVRRLEPDFLPLQDAVFREGVARGGEALAMGWIELGRLRFLSPARSYPGIQGYIHHSRRIAELGMHLALAKGNAEAAANVLDASLDLLLHDAPDVHGRLVARGRTDFARTFATTAFDRMHERLKAFPRAVEMRNNAAWLAAVSRERMPAALALLEETEAAGVALPVHTRDTRAELLFQLGRDAEALALAEKNAAEAADDAYLKRQVERMRKGDRASPAQ